MISIEGKNINLRLIEQEDANFVIDLRLKKGEFLSSTSKNIDDQKYWIKEYKKRELKKEEYYFIIEDKKRIKIGTIRIYDIAGDSFCWGSWLIKNNTPYQYSIESAMILYNFAFNKLKFSQSHFDVRKNNLSVIRFHKKFGANIIKEDNKNYFFILKKDDYILSSKRYIKYLV